MKLNEPIWSTDLSVYSKLTIYELTFDNEFVIFIYQLVNLLILLRLKLISSLGIKLLV